MALGRNNLRFLDRDSPLQLDGEEWREAMPGIEVSNFGRCRKTVAYIVQGYLSSGGYPAVTVDGKSYLIHRLVAHTFIGPIPEGYEVNHKDAERMNARVDNLEIVTHMDNMRHAARLGLLKNRLTPEQRTELVRERIAGAKVDELCAKYGITRSAVWNLCAHWAKQIKEGGRGPSR